MDPNIVILAAGISSRMKKSAPREAGVDPHFAHDVQSKPKSMICVGKMERPFLDYLLDNVRQAGYSDVVLVVGENDRAIQDYYGPSGSHSRTPGLTISYVLQTIPEGRTKPLGTADALAGALKARPAWKGRRFTVCNSDNLYSVNALRLLLETPHECAVIDYDRAALQFDQSRFEEFAVIRKDREGYVTQIIEKPTREQLASAADGCGRIGVSMNIFRLSYDRILPILDEVPLHPLRDEKELPEAVMMLVERHPKSVMTVPLSEHVPDLTYQQDILRVQEFLGNDCASIP